MRKWTKVQGHGYDHSNQIDEFEHKTHVVETITSSGLIYFLKNLPMDSIFLRYEVHAWRKIVQLNVF